MPLLDNVIDNDQSPYEEVAANVSNKDDPFMSCLTFRSVFTGILLTCLASFTSQFFAYRTSPLTINIDLIILLSYMIGKFLSKVLPEKLFNISLNSGAFSVKEHTLSTIMAFSGSGAIYVIEALTTERLYYKYYRHHFDAILLLIITKSTCFVNSRNFEKISCLASCNDMARDIA